jgi:hypothetical protein
MNLRWRRLLTLTTVLLLVPLQGCVTQAKARAQAEAAFAAGRREALANLGSGENQAPLVTIVGNVKTPVLAWTPNLTLAQAIVLSEYQDATEPEEIFIVRRGRALRSTAEELLKGEDILLEPGDVIQLGRR